MFRSHDDPLTSDLVAVGVAAPVAVTGVGLGRGPGRGCRARDPTVAFDQKRQARLKCRTAQRVLVVP
jgi:hypothetical protein